MKELSIEEKAKRYDEALERYKAKQEYESKEVHKFIEYIFPELKESDDERIRKALIRFHKSTIDIDGIKSTDVIAWLEKQGEQKSAWSEEDESNLDLAIYHIRREPYRESDVEPIVDWLRTLKGRCTWKPSDEQIKALEAILTVSPQSPAMTSALLGLYEQLKKQKD